MKIVTIITIIFLLLALLGSIGGASYYYYNSVEEMKEQVFNHLETTAQSRAHHLETFFNDKKILAENLALIGKVERLLLANKNDGDYEEKVKAVNERLQKTVEFNTGDIYRIRVLDKNSIIIASTHESDIGLDRKNIFSGEEQEIFIRNLETSEKANEPLMNIQQPVIVNSEFLGLVIMDMELSILDHIIVDKTGLGETGEIYLINKDKYLLTPCSFMIEPACKRLTQKVDTINSRNCLSHSQENEEEYEEHEEVQIFLDYEGEKVIGTYIYISELDLCLLAEMDESEILGNQRKLFQKIILRIIIILTILFGLIGYFLGKYLSKIFILKKGKKRL